MKLLFDPEIITWFENWNKKFDWNKGNTSKNEKHGIKAEEIEKIFETPVYIAGKILESETEDRWLLLGEFKNKGWSLVFTTRGKKLRVISCRRQREKESQFYEEFKKEI